MFRIGTWMTLLVMVACGGAGEAGDECEVDDDCAEGMHCHPADDHDHDHEEGEDHGSGTCMLDADMDA